MEGAPGVTQRGSFAGGITCFKGCVWVRHARQGTSARIGGAWGRMQGTPGGWVVGRHRPAWRAREADPLTGHVQVVAARGCVRVRHRGVRTVCALQYNACGVCGNVCVCAVSALRPAVLVQQGNSRGCDMCVRWRCVARCVMRWAHCSAQMRVTVLKCLVLRVLGRMRPR
jgi:hypothetical protein